MNDLSPRQKEILKILCTTGAKNKDIAENLGISPYTVGVHLQSIYNKLGIHKRTRLVAWYWKQDKKTRESYAGSSETLPPAQ